MSRPLAVIVPTLNEAAALPQLLAQLREQQDIALELIVSDGGSTDDTAALAQAAGARVLSGARGRGAQMNAGARAAAAPWLLFLHADSQVPEPRFLAQALHAMHHAGPCCAGHFALHFSRSAPGYAQLYRYLEGKSALNRPYTIHGDQGLLISAEFFRSLSGYDERPLMEDERLAAKIFARGRWLLLPGRLGTSARRFETEGHAQRYTLMALMMGLHAAGVDEFFTRAPRAYQTQDAAGQLRLAAYLPLIRQLLRERGRWRTLWQVGRFVRENTWQPFYYRDVVRNDGALRCLGFCDRWFYPLVANRFGDALAMLLVAAWFYLWLPLRTRH